MDLMPISKALLINIMLLCVILGTLIGLMLAKYLERRARGMTETDSPVGLLNLEDAIKKLGELGFTREEAVLFLATPDKMGRLRITLQVQKRLKGGERV